MVGGKDLRRGERKPVAGVAWRRVLRAREKEKLRSTSYPQDGDSLPNPCLRVLNSFEMGQYHGVTFTGKRCL